MISGKISYLFGVGAAVGIALSLSACDFEKDDIKVRNPRVRYEPVYDERICTISKNQGEGIVGSRAERIVVSSFFGKRYDRSMLDNVLSASAVATSQYVSELLGGRAFRVPRDSTPGLIVCPMFTDLPVAPDDLRDLWDRYAGVGLGGWRLAGLYFEDCGREGFACDDREMVRPTILVDEARDRWTLVHEMMHFNFSRERKRDPQMPTLSSLATTANATKVFVKSAYDSYQANPGNRALLSSLQKESSWLTRTWFYHTMVHTVLEEVAVEGIMMDEYLAGHLKNVSPAALDVAVMYMEKSQQRMLTEYEAPSIQAGTAHLSLRSLRSFIYAEAKSRGWTDIQRSVEADVAFFSRWELSLSKMIAERRARIFDFQQGQSVGGVMTSASSTLEFSDGAERAAADHFPGHIQSSVGWRAFQSWKD